MEIKLTQGTPEWHEFRKTKIGSSDYAVIAAHRGECVNLFDKSLASIVKNKYQAKKNNNPIFARGHEREEIIRKQMQEQYPNARPAVFVHNTISYLGASLDLYCPDNNIIWEIKLITAQRKNPMEAIPYYLMQVLHQAMIVKPKQAFLLLYHEELDQLQEIELPQVWLDDYNVELNWLHNCDVFYREYMQFYHNYLEDNASDLTNLNALIEKYYLLRNKKKNLDEKIKSMEEQLEILMQDKEMFAGQTHLLSKVYTSIVDYEKELHDLYIPEEYIEKKINYSKFIKDYNIEIDKKNIKKKFKNWAVRVIEE